MATISESYDYVIVGAGVAGAAAVRGIRQVDPRGTIAVLGAEPDRPVYRPDLSKTLWLKEGATLEAATLDTADAEVHLDTRVTGVDPTARRVSLGDGREVGYGRLLLATGAEPRTTDLPPGPRVVYFRTAQDFRTLRAVTPPGSSVVVVGGGYIGSEMASALAQNDVEVTMVLDLELVQQTMFPAGLARAITDDFAGRGVRIVHGMLAGGDVGEEAVTVRLDDGTELAADAVVIGIGVVPRTGLASAAGLTLAGDGGIEVDATLRTSADGIWAAGDVASYPDSRLGRRRVEHVDAAETMGETAGRAMAGGEATYTHTPFFWSDLFDAGYEAIGEVSSRHETVEDWKDDDHGTGVVYYVDSGRVRGVLLWNVWDSVPKAEALIEETSEQPLDDVAALRGRIPLG